MDMRVSPYHVDQTFHTFTIKEKEK